MGKGRVILGVLLRMYLFLALFMFASGVVAGAWLAISARNLA